MLETVMVIIFMIMFHKVCEEMGDKGLIVTLLMFVRILKVVFDVCRGRDSILFDNI
jgi:hypothetical protein